jgi:hypothetical protein
MMDRGRLYFAQFGKNKIYYILPLSLNVDRHDLRADNFDSIYRKYMQYFYL